MKIFRNALHYWIAIASVLSFLGGWAILAHSPKPIQAATVQVTPLPAIQAYDGSTNNNDRGFFSTDSQGSPQQSYGMPLLRTRGS
jgi:hypothetical protein